MVLLRPFHFLRPHFGGLLLTHCCDLQCVTIVVKKVKSCQISEKQLQVLLAYAEEDIYDTTRQATAFGLLKVRCCQMVVLNVCVRASNP